MKLQVNKITNQIFVYLPKSIIDAMGWKGGEEITPTIQGKDMILLKKFSKQSPPSNTRGDL